MTHADFIRFFLEVRSKMWVELECILVNVCPRMWYAYKKYLVCFKCNHYFIRNHIFEILLWNKRTIRENIQNTPISFWIFSRRRQYTFYKWYEGVKFKQSLQFLYKFCRNCSKCTFWTSVLWILIVYCKAASFCIFPYPTILCTLSRI